MIRKGLGIDKSFMLLIIRVNIGWGIFARLDEWSGIATSTLQCYKKMSILFFSLPITSLSIYI